MRPLRLPVAWRRAPRRLRATRAGLLVLFAAVALGLVAIFSGNNPLFFLWGVVLGGIVVSGVLSEATLRPLQVGVEWQRPLRAGESAGIYLHVHNRSRVLPALAVTWTVAVVDAAGRFWRPQSYVLRLGAAEHVRLTLPLTPGRRGSLDVASIVAATAFPFGLFVKERPFFLAVPPALARPARAALAAPTLRPSARASLPGHAREASGEDVAQLREFRPGDPLRRVLWRRVASTGRWLVAEHDGERNHSVVLEVRAAAAGSAPAAASAAELLLSFAGSLAEDLLRGANTVGLWTHGTTVAVAAGPAQAGRILDALARVDLSAALPGRPPPGGEVIDVAALWAAARARTSAS